MRRILSTLCTLAGLALTACGDAPTAPGVALADQVSYDGGTLGAGHRATGGGITDGGTSDTSTTTESCEDKVAGGTLGTGHRTCDTTP
jgi:hypothetical protein